MQSLVDFRWWRSRAPQSIGEPRLDIEINVAVVGTEYVSACVEPFFKLTGTAGSRGDYVHSYSIPLDPARIDRTVITLWHALEHFGTHVPRGDQLYGFRPRVDLGVPLLDIEMLAGALAYMRHCGPIGRDSSSVVEAVQLTARYLGLEAGDVQLAWQNALWEFEFSCALFYVKRSGALGAADNNGSYIARGRGDHCYSFIWLLPLLAGLAQIKRLYIEDRLEKKFKAA